MSHKNELWEDIYRECGYAACQLSLLLDLFDQMIDWCSEAGQEFPLECDGFKGDLITAIKLINAIKEHAEFAKNDLSEGSLYAG